MGNGIFDLEVESPPGYHISLFDSHIPFFEGEKYGMLNVLQRLLFDDRLRT